ncbi:5-bromo-4-chloroindolyl phosphate hydrolysis family protein [uncultured Cohaesibacter sp.]|uniref:5-bromo-4-chloroindolyl phosphate hydrolysis family protein n=1 Tax=uncultured Cohaesibacter sp. TaxID=1002546 RepID=UPI002931BFAD|nr:5-bromo-4-chloroindolyl phosphate hydrolysis family protein [uncultured Cohaesibacter sp.]
MSASALNNVRLFIAIVVGATIGLWSYFAMHMTIYIAIAVAIAAFVLMHFIIPKKQQDNEVFVASGVTREDSRAAVKQGKEQAERLEIAIRRTPKSDPAQEILRKIQDVFVDIYANLEKDPGDIPRSRAFLDFHSGDAIGLIEGYSGLVSGRLPDDKQLEQVEAARRRFVSIEKAFRAQYNAMLSNDVSALEQAGRNLESSLRLEHGLEKLTTRD